METSLLSIKRGAAAFAAGALAVSFLPTGIADGFDVTGMLNANTATEANVSAQDKDDNGSLHVDGSAKNSVAAAVAAKGNKDSSFVAGVASKTRANTKVHADHDDSLQVKANADTEAAAAAKAESSDENDSFKIHGESKTHMESALRVRAESEGNNDNDEYSSSSPNSSISSSVNSSSDMNSSSYKTDNEDDGFLRDLLDL